jgi:2'-5' RNA ligase
MRVFAALPLPPAALQRLEGAVAELRDRARTARSGGLRAVRPEGMHITLIFFGELEGERLEQIRSALGNPSLPGPPIAASIGGLGQFPPRGMPRVLYCPVRGGAKEIEGLYGRLRASALAAWGGGRSGAGYSDGSDEPVPGDGEVGERTQPGGQARPPWDDRRSFTPHVTVARNRGGHVAVTDLRAPFDFEEPALLERLVLFQSILGPGGAEYRPLETVHFMGERGQPCEPWT